jgi:hypothetical protein
MMRTRLRTVLLAAALCLFCVAGAWWRREGQGRVYTDLEVQSRLGSILDATALARALEQGLGRPFVVVEPTSGAPSTLEAMSGRFSVGLVHHQSYQEVCASRPMRVLYWLPDSPEREVVMVRAAGGVPDGLRGATTPACSKIARWMLGPVVSGMTQLRVRDVLHEGVPAPQPGDGRPFRWIGLVAQPLLAGEFDFMVAETRRLREETLPEQRARLRVTAAVVPASPFILVALPEAAPELLEAVKAALPADLFGPWAMPPGEPKDLDSVLPLLVSRAVKRYTTPPGGVPLEEARR